MAKGYKYLEEATYADVCFEAYGKNLEEVFTNAGLATCEIMADLKTVEPNVKKKISLKNESVDKLLFEFLEEIIFLKDSERLLFSKIKMKIIKNKEYALDAELSGEEINPKKHKLGNDAKAVTYHDFVVEEKKGKWRAKVIIDI